MLTLLVNLLFEVLAENTRLPDLMIFFEIVYKYEIHSISKENVWSVQFSVSFICIDDERAIVFEK